MWAYGSCIRPLTRLPVLFALLGALACAKGTEIGENEVVILPSLPATDGPDASAPVATPASTSADAGTPVAPAPANSPTEPTGDAGT
jgi:hypothetical protein